jgi:hypothetical protein
VPTVAEVFAPSQLGTYYHWRDAAEAVLATRNAKPKPKPDNVDRAVELEQWRAVWRTA